MRIRGMWRWALAVLCGLAVLCAVAPRAFAAASTAHAVGRVALSLPGGRSGPLELTAGQGGWVGTMTVTNVGADPLIVSRVAILGDEDDVRSPAHVSVRFAEGPSTSATLPPGGSKDIVVSWMPDRNPRTRQAFGHVVVTSTDEATGEVAMGFRAELPTGLGWFGVHLLSLFVLLPFAVPIAAVVARSFGRQDGKVTRLTFFSVSVLELAAAIWAYAHFLPDLGRADGNEGYQFVERAVWVRSVGAEWYLGLDGVSAILVPLVAVLVVVAASIRPPDHRVDAYFSALALLATGIMASLLALDLSLLFSAWQIFVVAIVMLVGGWGRRRGELAAAKMAAYGALGSGALVVLFVALTNASGKAFLVDGSAVAHSLSIPELARTSFAAKSSMLGVPFVEVSWVLLVIAAGVVSPIVPLHGWITDVLEEAPAGAAVLVSGAAVALGPYLVVRVGLGVIPEGARWAGSAVSALGVLGVVYGSLCALAQRDLRRFVAYTTLASAGACLFGVGALTPQGIAAAVVGLFAHGLAAAMVLGFASAVERRVHTSQLDRLGGLASEMPALAAVAAVGLAVSLGVPGFVGFWGGLLSLMGGFVRHPALAVLMSAAFVAAAAAHARVARLVLLGRVPQAWRRSRLLEPFGGHFPDATLDELLALLPLVAAALVLGLWPTPLLSPMATSVREMSAVVDPGAADPALVNK